MAGPNVNHRFYDEFSTEINETTNHSLINVGTCSLHVVHGSFKTGATAADWGIKK